MSFPVAGFNTSFTNDTFISSNFTRTPYQVWTFVPSFSLAVLIASVLLNGTILSMFLVHDHLYTPFNIYIINLLSANLLNILIQVPIYLVANLRSYWWIGRPACTAYLYGFFIQAGMCNAHALISMNRLWAVLQPTSYRRLHTKRVAWSLCAGMWIYIHALKLPGILLDALYYRLPEEQVGCFQNNAPMMGYAYVHHFVVFDIPAAFILSTYPIIGYQQWKRRRFMQRSVGDRNSAPAGQVVLTGQHPSSLNRTSLYIPPIGQDQARRRRQTNSFLVLSCVTFSLLVFWLPTIVYYTALLFDPNLPWDGLQQVATVLWFLEPVADPILFSLALTDLRKALSSLFDKNN